MQFDKDALIASTRHAGLGMHWGIGISLAEQARRTAATTAAYLAQGRDRPSHPLHGLTTGLFLPQEDVFAPVEEETDARD
jgi:hypothetical protein